MLTHLDLASGIGGFALAAMWAGFETIAFVEKDDYCQKVLKKHWPDVPIVGDIRDVEGIKKVVANATRGRFQQCKREQAETDDFSQMGKVGMEYKRTDRKSSVTLVTAGLPCQPASVAGKRRGTTDDRWLWPEGLQILSEIQPTWAIFENPTGILTLEEGLVFDDLLSEMESKGYEVQPLVIPACAVNAPHRRDRVWIIAHNEGVRLCSTEENTKLGRNFRFTKCYQRNRKSVNNMWAVEPKFCGMVNELSERLDKNRLSETRCGTQELLLQDMWQAITEIGYVSASLSEIPKIWESLNDKEKDWIVIRCCTRDPFCSEWPDIPRVAIGVKNRVDRLKCLGNAIVPQVAYEILKPIVDMELGL